MELFFLVVGAVEEILDIGYWWKIWLKVTAEKLVEQIFSSSSIFLENWHDFFEHQSFADFLGFEQMVEDLLVFHGEELFEWHWLLAFVEGKNAFLPLCQDAVLDLCDLLSSWHFSCHARLCDGIYVTEIIVFFAILWLRGGQNYFSQIGG